MCRARCLRVDVSWLSSWSARYLMRALREQAIKHAFRSSAAHNAQVGLLRSRKDIPVSYQTIISAVGLGTLALGLPAAAAAQNSLYFGVQSAPSYGYYEAPRYSRHHLEHDQLDERHGDVHDALDEQHALAHGEGLSPWEHARLHDELDYQHERADYQIAREHQRQHRYRSWQRNYLSYGYNGYYRN